MLVLDPIPVVIENLPDDYVEMIDLPFSKDPSHGVSARGIMHLYASFTTVADTYLVSHCTIYQDRLH